MMGLVGLLRAVAYRELVWFRRFLADYVVSWIFPSVLSLMIIFLPTLVGGIDVVLSRFNSLFGVNVDVTQVLLASVVISGLVPVVAITITDVCHTIFAEFKYLEVSTTLLECTSLKEYLLANALVRAPIMTFCITLYLIPITILLSGINGLLTYVYVEIILQLTSITLSLYSTIIATLLVFYTGISRPWTVINLVPPAILAGSGIYLQGYTIPLVLRVFALTTPVPQVSELLKLIALGFSLRDLVDVLAISSSLLTLYLTLVGFMGVRVDAKVRK